MKYHSESTDEIVSLEHALLMEAWTSSDSSDLDCLWLVAL